MNIGRKGDGLIDGYNNEAVKGGGCPRFFIYIFFVVDGTCVCVCVCVQWSTSLKNENL